MKTSLVLVAVALVTGFASLSFADHHRTTTKADFQEWCDAWEGRWVGEVTFVADWPGLGKRGEKVTAYLQATKIEDGKGMTWKFFGGVGSGTVLIAYDTAAQQIKSMSVVSGGFTGSGIFYKKDGTWMQEAVGSLPDGRKSEGVTIYEFSEGGKKVVTTGSGSVDGKPNEKLNDVWRRVSK
jgi:hypothetical protein